MSASAEETAREMYYAWARRRLLTGHEWPGMWRAEPGSVAIEVDVEMRQRWISFAALVLEVHEREMAA